ncbi:MAG: CRISPR-associated endonuclease Cas2 [Candidatus Yonathbacteria bacterium RIFCSPLOWO2_01_FULL_47_33b]|uniref:CRISPR-associated endonuclease Cas2 n=1 Tax=Candidatus Yonathbacteria bacterium RIFCSPLOWO2_01_FULL_47_33b TaxID=1802727 RepID=A0A1G2SGB0_9BACT|nr:MAG: CRISPR-associated endonuclease Cas2 [Candidatus Yonathbacteria bacterium RIFCSPLOWO2_01_FULL_47_33b]
MKNYEHGELAKEILIGLANTGLLVACLAMPGLTKIIPLFDPKNVKEKYRVNRTLTSLQKNKLVNIYTKNGNEVIEITKAGKKKVLEYNLDELKLNVPKKWDGWWRIVMFDIPESKRRSRSAVSRKIKELGLYPIQKSVFVSPYLCKNEIDFVGEFFGVRDNIIYIKAKEIEGVSELKEYFRI